MGFEPTYRHPIVLTRPLRLGSANYNQSRLSQPWRMGHNFSGWRQAALRRSATMADNSGSGSLPQSFHHGRGGRGGRGRGGWKFKPPLHAQSGAPAAVECGSKSRQTQLCKPTSRAPFRAPQADHAGVGRFSHRDHGTSHKRYSKKKWRNSPNCYNQWANTGAQ